MKYTSDYPKEFTRYNCKEGYCPTEELLIGTCQSKGSVHWYSVPRVLLVLRSSVKKASLGEVFLKELVDWEN